MPNEQWRILSRDPLAGVVQKFRYDPYTGDREIVTEQDCDPIAEVTKAQMNQTDERARWKKTMNKVMSIPLSVIYDLQVKRGVNLFKDKKELKRFVNDPDNKVFRTRSGHV